MVLLRWLVLPMACLAPLACDRASDDDDGAAADAGSGGSSSGGEAGGSSPCASETRNDVYMVGMEKVGEQLAVRIVDAMPAPPERFDNAWTIEVLDAATMQPRTDATLEVEPFMPDHNHGSSVKCEVTPMDAAGQYQLDPINLFMPGLWEVRLHFTLADMSKDELVFKFCVDP